MSWVAEKPQAFKGQVVGNGQCVAYVRAAAAAAHTPEWKRGAHVKAGAPPSGTAIATFDPNGGYGNHTDGRSHAAIFVEMAEGGFWVWDQWRGHRVDRRLVHYRAGQGHAANDADQFYVIERA